MRFSHCSSSSMTGWPMPVSYLFTDIYRLSFQIIMSSQTETNSGSKCTSSIHECDLVGESINLRSLIYSHSLFHYMGASLHQLLQIGIYLATTIVNSTRSSVPVLIILCSDPLGQICRTPPEWIVVGMIRYFSSLYIRTVINPVPPFIPGNASSSILLKSIIISSNKLRFICLLYLSSLSLWLERHQQSYSVLHPSSPQHQRLLRLHRQ